MGKETGWLIVSIIPLLSNLTHFGLVEMIRVWEGERDLDSPVISDWFGKGHHLHVSIALWRVNATLTPILSGLVGLSSKTTL